MRIEIASRLKPFSHQYQSRCRLPGGEVAKIYPASIELHGSIHALPIQGPVKDFTTLLDLEKGRLSVFGHYKSGYLREEIDTAAPSPHFERVSFGCHKAQNWEQMHVRHSLDEWLPHWHRLAQWEGDITQVEPAAPNTILHKCQQANRLDLGDALMELFDGSFVDYFVNAPQRWQQLGLAFAPAHNQNILVQGAALLRHSLIRQSDDSLFVLPNLPKELIAGRYLNAVMPWGTIDFEWSKGLIRRLILKFNTQAALHLHFQKEVRTFRMKKSDRKEAVFLTNNSFVNFEGKASYFLDRFEK